MYEKKNWPQQTVGIQEGQSPRNLFVSIVASTTEKNTRMQPQGNENHAQAWMLAMASATTWVTL